MEIEGFQSSKIQAIVISVNDYVACYKRDSNLYKFLLGKHNGLQGKIATKWEEHLNLNYSLEEWSNICEQPTAISINESHGWIRLNCISLAKMSLFRGLGPGLYIYI